MRRIRRGVFRILAITCLGLWLAANGSLAAEPPVSQFSTHGRNLYRLASAELSGSDDQHEVVGATYDQRISAFEADGQHRWDFPVDGFVYDLAAGDLDADGMDEILAACADGQVYAIDSDGGMLWKHEMQAPVWQVAIARQADGHRVALAGGVSRKVVALSGTGQVLAETPAWSLIGAVRMMRAGDFNGDGQDEVAVLPLRGQAKDLVFFNLPDLKPRKESVTFQTRRSGSASEPNAPFTLPRRLGGPVWTSQKLRKANGCTGDLNGDGADELCFIPGAFSLRDGIHQVVEFPEIFRVPSYDQFYNMRIVTVGNLTDSPGAEIVLLEGHQIRLLDHRGKTLGTASAPFGFADVVYVPGKPHGHVLLGSSPNGDDNVYRLDFRDGWEAALSRLRRQGRMAAVDANLKQLAADIANWDGQPVEGAGGPYDIVIDHHMWNGADLKQLDGWIVNVRDFEREFPYENLRFSTCFWPGEDTPRIRPDGKRWIRDHRLAHDLTRDIIVAGAKRFEAAKELAPEASGPL